MLLTEIQSSLRDLHQHVPSVKNMKIENRQIIDCSGYNLLKLVASGGPGVIKVKESDDGKNWRVCLVYETLCFHFIEEHYRIRGKYLTVESIGDNDDDPIEMFVELTSLPAPKKKTSKNRSNEKGLRGCEYCGSIVEGVKCDGCGARMRI